MAVIEQDLWPVERLVSPPSEKSRPEQLLRWAFETFGRRAALISSFQAEAMVLIDMAARINRDCRVITIDTGRLPQETNDLIQETRRRYGIKPEVIHPDNPAVEQMVSEHGPNLFFDDVDLRLRCCHVRKVEPLRRALDGLDCWMTGLRREQTRSRASIRKVEVDEAHGGILKLSPLADWTHDDVWAYIRRHDVPYHRLYDHGYTSIGCAPCTRPVLEGEDARAGRWWWESGGEKECGMHCSLESGSLQQQLQGIGAR